MAVNPASVVGCGPTPGPCAPSYDSFKILRGAPYVNLQNPALSNIWFAQIVGTPGKVHDPNNFINVTNFQSQIHHPSPDGVPLDGLIVDSTRMIIQNMVNNTMSEISQEDAYQMFSNTVTISSTLIPKGCPNVTQCTPDGVLQFLALISIAPSCTWLGTGLIVTISPLASNALYANATYGNWCPFNFSIGNCNSQSACASLLYLTCPTASGIGYSYHANYANVRFTLLNKCKVAAGGAKKAHFLAVDSLDKTNFLVFFGQQRLIGAAQMLLISPIVDLRCVIWQPVFLVTSNTPLSLSCGAVIA